MFIEDNIKQVIANSILPAAEAEGIKIVKWTDDNVIYITVPKVSKSKVTPQIKGEILASQFKKLLNDLSNQKIIIKYKIED
jgi:hypothetical protein